MGEPNNQRKAGTGKSALGLAVMVILLLVAGGGIVYMFSQPDLFESVMQTVALVLLVIGALICAVYIAMVLLAVPMYAYKGETYQENVDYDLDDIRSVGEKTEKEDDPKV